MNLGSIIKLSIMALIMALTAPLMVSAQEGSMSDSYNLIKAVKDKDYAKLQNYLQKGANVNARDYENGATPLYLASAQKDTVMVTLLLKEKAKTEIGTRSTGETPLMVAARLSAKEVVDILISQNADINIADRGGETALYKAVSRNDRTMVKTLLDANADWSIADNTGRTPLDIAKENRRLRSMVRILEDAGVEY